MPLQESIKSGLDYLLEFIYPSTCLVCDNYIGKSGELICPDCWNRIDTLDYPFCANCEEPLPDTLKCSNCDSPHTLPIIALGQFTDPLGEIVRQFKYRKYISLGKPLAERLVNSHSQILEKTDIDVIIPIPLHSYRQKWRGFNQAEVLADIIGKRLEIPIDTNSLKKVKHNKYQKSLDPDGRAKNVRHVYRAVEGDIKGKKVLLIDDVITTGATLREAQQVLTAVGAIVKLGAVIAAAGLSDL